MLYLKNCKGIFVEALPISRANVVLTTEESVRILAPVLAAYVSVVRLEHSIAELSLN